MDIAGRPLAAKAQLPGHCFDNRRIRVAVDEARKVTDEVDVAVPINSAGHAPLRSHRQRGRPWRPLEVGSLDLSHLADTTWVV